MSVTARTGTDGGEHRQHIVLFGSQVIILNLCYHLRGLLQRRARRQLYLSKKYAAIFQRQEGGRQTNKQECHHADNRQVEQQPAAALQQNARYAALVAFGAGIEVTVKPAEKAAPAMVLALRQRFEQRGAQRGRQNHRHQHRQHHRRDNGDGELAIDSAHGAAKERHRHKHCGQHQRDTHQRTLNLPHRFTRGGTRR